MFARIKRSALNASPTIIDRARLARRDRIVAARRDAAAYIDRAFLFGRDRSMVAIVTSPATTVLEDRPTVVILNTGIIHRVGHHRKYVLLARALAERGIRTIRFDLSGIGDSDRRNDSLAPLDAAQADTAEVLDWAQAKYGAQAFVLVGLCLGADYAVVRGGVDRRVVGTVLIDPSLPPTRRFYRRYFVQRLVRLDSWAYAARHIPATFTKLAGTARNVSQETSTASDSPGLHHPSVRAFLNEAYRALIANDVRILGVFTAGIQFQHNYREQILEAFPEIDFGSHLTLSYFGKSDHTFTWEVHRQRLLSLIAKWLVTTDFREVVQTPADEDELDVAMF